MRVDQLRIQISHALLQPFLIRSAALQTVVNFVGIQQPAVDEINGKHLPRTETPFLHDVLFIVVVDADFRRDRDMSILGDHVARRPQPVAIQAAGCITSVGQNDAGGPVPRLHLAIEELVKGPYFRVDIVHGLPRRRHQDAHRLQHVHAARPQHLEHVVETRRVRSRERDDRIQIRDVVKLVGAEILCARLCPIAVALDRIDLAVVGKESERLCETPFRQSIRREPLVEQADGGFQARVAQVRVKLRQRPGHDHPLVADRDRRQAGDIRFPVVEAILRTPPREKQAPVEAAALHSFGRVHENLLDARQGLECDLAASRRIGRHLAPAGDLETGLADGGLDHGARRRRNRLVVAQEYGPGGESIGEREAQFLADLAEKAKRKLDQQPATIAGLAVRSDGTAMREAGQGSDRRLHHEVARQIVEIGYQPEAAAVALERGAIEPCCSCTSLYRSLRHSRPGSRVARPRFWYLH